MFRETGKLLVVFVLGSFATIVGTLAAAKLFPLAALGSDAWKVAAALNARHIGGAVNYVAVADATGMSASAQSAGLAADNVVCAGAPASPDASVAAAVCALLSCKLLAQAVDPEVYTVGMHTLVTGMIRQGYLTILKSCLVTLFRS